MTYLLTVIGTVAVLFFRTAPRMLMDAIMGFAAVVMVAASYWSLLVPAIERGGVGVATVGLLAGARGAVFCRWSLDRATGRLMTSSRFVE